MRYFIKLAYDGTNFHGWQVQENAHTVQAELEQKLSLLLGRKIEVTGCGRTDTGVHAKEFYAHFDIDELPIRPKDLIYKLNRFLTPDIAVYELFEVPDELHARFSAIARTYQYHMHYFKDPFAIRYSHFIPSKPHIGKMNEAAAYLLEYDDFTSFSKLHTQTYTNLCKIKEAFWEKNGHHLVFTITADRFLRNMVRAIVGTLLEIGKGDMEPDEIKKVIEAKDRGKAGVSVPAKGLFLEKIVYDFNLQDVF